MLNANWQFGLDQLINGISALMTFVAVCVSLYLSQKSRTLKFKILGKKINIKAMTSKEYQKIEIVNTGHIKFTCSTVGYYIDKKYFFVDNIRCMKKLDNIRIEKREYSTSTTNIEDYLLPVYVLEGDMLELGLFPHEYDFSSIKKNKRVYLFVLINGKIYKKYVGMKFYKFKDLCKNFKAVSLYTKNNYNKNNQSERNVRETYFR